MICSMQTKLFHDVTPSFSSRKTHQDTIISFDKQSICSEQVPLVKRTFASADETHIRVWGPAIPAVLVFARGHEQQVKIIRLLLDVYSYIFYWIPIGTVGRFNNVHL